MWLSLVKKSTTILVFKRLHIGMCDYLHWFILSCTCTNLTLAPGSMFCFVVVVVVVFFQIYIVFSFY